MQSKRKKILFLSGDARFLISHRLNLIVGALADGYDVTVASPASFPAVDTIRSTGADWVEWKVDRGGTSLTGELVGLIRVLSITRITRPTLIHAVGIKCILHGGISSKLLGTPMVGAVSGLGYIYTGVGDWRKKALRRGVNFFLRFWLNRRDVSLVFQNKQDAELVELAHLSRVSVHFIGGSGVDLDEISVRPHPSDERTRVGLPARLLGDKGVYEFIASARELKSRGRNVEFVLIGDPDPNNPTSISSEEIDGWVKEGIVQWMPHTSDIAEVLGKLHIVALPSYREGFPKTLIDAAAAGRAAVASNVAGCRDAIVDGETGLLCAVQDSRALADCLDRLVLDRKACIAMGAAARAHAEEHFDVADVTRRHLEIYRERSTSGRTV